jgi:hypothetical protein
VSIIGTLGATLAKVAHSLKVPAIFFAVLAAGAALDPAADVEHVAQDRGRLCVALAGFAEARSDGAEAMVEVMRVVVNRANDPAHRWPRDLCGVVFQPAQFVGIQSVRPNVVELPAWRRALELADAVIANRLRGLAECRGATSFHQAHDVAGLVPVCHVGVHTFFTERSNRTMNAQSINAPVIRVRDDRVHGVTGSVEQYRDKQYEKLALAGDRVYQFAGQFESRECGNEPIPFAVGQRVKTRDGRSARIISTDREHVDGYCVVALVSGSPRGECVECFNASGEYLVGMTHEIDLVQNRTPRETHVVFVPAV